MGAPKKKKEDLSVIHARIDRLLAEEVRKAAIAERVSVRFLVEKSLRQMFAFDRDSFLRLLEGDSPVAKKLGEDALRRLDRTLTSIVTRLDRDAECRRRGRELLGVIEHGDPREYGPDAVDDRDHQAVVAA